MITDQERKTARILIVDDEEINVRIVERLLGKAGYQDLKGISNPLHFEKAFREFRPDLVILDLNMPVLDGFTILETEEFHDGTYLPVLVLTGDTNPETRRRALGLGARDFVCKPFDRFELFCRVENLLEVRLLHRKLYAQNKDLENRVRERTLALQEAHFEMVRRLGMAAEYRDDETGLHISRMSRYAVVVARAMGMPIEQREQLLHAAALHDVGKIGIPDHVLLKKGKLTPEEWEIMKSHAKIGAELMRGGSSELMKMAERVARWHHERWDGKGYPDGLRGEQIPLEARISTVCDVFDALTSERPYKQAWTVEDAVAEIQRCSGTQFDPRLVNIFMQVLPEILDIKERYSREGEPFNSGNGRYQTSQDSKPQEVPA
ncbi:MAG: HD domain-containing phosphohydrolase [Vulcanimicrobiota bacterium]